MLEEHEWDQIEPLLMKRNQIIKEYRAKTGCDIEQAMEEALSPQKKNTLS